MRHLWLYLLVVLCKGNNPATIKHGNIFAYLFFSIFLSCTTSYTFLPRVESVDIRGVCDT